MLAKAANELLDSLYQGNIGETTLIGFSSKKYDNPKSEEEEIEEVSAWMTSVGLNEGTTNHELLGEDGTVAAIIDLAWPQGIQKGLSEPIALLLNETAETQAIVSKHGYRYYTSVDELKEYIQSTYLTE